MSESSSANNSTTPTTAPNSPSATSAPSFTTSNNRKAEEFNVLKKGLEKFIDKKDQFAHRSEFFSVITKNITLESVMGNIVSPVLLKRAKSSRISPNSDDKFAVVDQVVNIIIKGNQKQIEKEGISTRKSDKDIEEETEEIRTNFLSKYLERSTNHEIVKKSAGDKPSAVAPAAVVKVPSQSERAYSISRKVVQLGKVRSGCGPILPPALVDN